MSSAPPLPVEALGSVDAAFWRPPVVEGTAARQNFGDELGPLVVRALLAARGIEPETSNGPRRRLLSVGSIVHFAQNDDVIWGTGINGKVRRPKLPFDLDIRAVRGPFTASALRSRGFEVPDIFGDPALLIPSLFPETRTWSLEKTRKIAVVPNLNDLERYIDHPDLISPLAPVWEVIRAIAQSERVIASSLHGIVLAEALGVPVVPLESSAEVSFKYDDYMRGTGRNSFRFANTLDEAFKASPLPPLDWNPQPLLDAFPRDLWEPASDSAGNETHPSSSHQRAQESARTPRVSIIVPAHNVEPWIDECLSSLSTQTERSIEIIVVDDHSKDGTRDRILAAVARDPRIRLIDAEERGGANARNLGMSHARGEYFAFADGDDLVPREAIAALLHSAEHSGSELVLGKFVKFYTSSIWRPTQNWEAFNSPKTAVSLGDHPSLIRGRACWNKLYHRSLVERAQIKFPEVPRSNDIVPVVTALTNARAIDVIEQVVYLYRDRPGPNSMTSQAVGLKSVHSYLTQELECRTLVDAYGSRALSEEFSRMFVHSDGLVHFRNALEKTATAPSSKDDAQYASAIADLLFEFLSSCSEATFEGLKPRPAAVYLALLDSWKSAQAIPADWKSLNAREIDQLVKLVESGRQRLGALHPLVQIVAAHVFQHVMTLPANDNFDAALCALAPSITPEFVPGLKAGSLDELTPTEIATFRARALFDTTPVTVSGMQFGSEGASITARLSEKLAGVEFEALASHRESGDDTVLGTAPVATDGVITLALDAQLDAFGAWDLLLRLRAAPGREGLDQRKILRWSPLGSVEIEQGSHVSLVIPEPVPGEGLVFLNPHPEVPTVAPRPLLTRIRTKVRNSIRR
ncbi:glycosyltransferase [Humidisolicoccus flavus]|uniref:glycosyltransferase n=1 Tax=Humidisolicoccus flavus TaxID=3111414 RepID=UPI00324968EF